jgi:hypothetical protein
VTPDNAHSDNGNAGLLEEPAVMEADNEPEAALKIISIGRYYRRQPSYRSSWINTFNRSNRKSRIIEGRGYQGDDTIVSHSLLYACDLNRKDGRHPHSSRPICKSELGSLVNH